MSICLYFVLPRYNKIPRLSLGTVHYTVYQIIYFKSIHFVEKILEFIYQELTGGGQEPEELLSDAVCREVAEELGIEVVAKGLSWE